MSGIPENFTDWPDRVWAGHPIPCRINIGLAEDMPALRVVAYSARECEASPEMEYVRKDLYNDSIVLEDAVRFHYNNEGFLRGILHNIATALGPMAFTDRDGNVSAAPRLDDLPRLVGIMTSNRVMPECVEKMRDWMEHDVPANEDMYHEHQDIINAVDDYYFGKADYRAFNLKRRDHMQGWRRYEKLRRLNVKQFSDLTERHLTSGDRFDDLVDDLP